MIWAFESTIRQVLEDAPDDSRILDQRNHPRRPLALGAFQGIGFVDLVDESRPGGFRASRKFSGRRLDRRRQSGAGWEKLSGHGRAKFR